MSPDLVRPGLAAVRGRWSTVIPRPRRSADDVKRDLARAVKDRGQARDRISELSRQITLATQEAQLLERHIDRLLGELSAAHRAEIAVTADRLVQQ